jgi:hypothetical protein
MTVPKDKKIEKIQEILDKDPDGSDTLKAAQDLTELILVKTPLDDMSDPSLQILLNALDHCEQR